MVRAKASQLWLTTPLNSGAILNLVPNSIFLTFFSMARAYGTTTPSALNLDKFWAHEGQLNNKSYQRVFYNSTWYQRPCPIKMKRDGDGSRPMKSGSSDGLYKVKKHKSETCEDTLNGIEE
ncbi:hypothetical protein Tco_0513429 [Tanacetum coccineum]